MRTIVNKIVSLYDGQVYDPLVQFRKRIACQTCIKIGLSLKHVADARDAFIVR